MSLRTVAQRNLLSHYTTSFIGFQGFGICMVIPGKSAVTTRSVRTVGAHFIAMISNRNWAINSQIQP